MPLKVVSLMGALAREAADAVAAQVGGACLAERGEIESLPITVSKRLVFGDGIVAEHRRVENPLRAIASLEGCNLVLLINLGEPLAHRILAVESVKEVDELRDEYTVAVTSSRPLEAEGLKYVPFSRLGEFIEALPIYPAWLDCGKCGHPTCVDYLKAGARGERVSCASAESRSVTLRVNGVPIGLVDFIENQLRELALAYLRTLKGIPEDIKTVELKINIARE